MPLPFLFMKHLTLCLKNGHAFEIPHLLSITKVDNMITFVIDDIKRNFYSNKVMYTYRMELTVDEDQMLYIKNAKQEDIDIRGLMKLPTKEADKIGGALLEKTGIM